MMCASVKRAAQRVDRLRDQRRAVVERHDTNACWQPRSNLADARFHAVDHLLRVGAAAHDHDAADRFRIPFDEGRHAERIADMHLTNLTHVHGHPGRRRDDDVLQVLG